MTFAALQALILKHGGRLSGSRAFGRPHEGSDWDYYVPSSRVRALFEKVRATGERFDSAITGAFTCWPEGIQVEVSDLFPRSQREYDRRSSRS